MYVAKIWSQFWSHGDFLAIIRSQIWSFKEKVWSFLKFWIWQHFIESAKKVAHLLDTEISFKVQNAMKISKTLLIPIFLMIGSCCCAIFDKEIAFLNANALFGPVVNAEGNLLKDKI
jgi:hypothetical protein